jgi:manganese transport protein
MGRHAGMLFSDSPTRSGQAILRREFDSSLPLARPRGLTAFLGAGSLVAVGYMDPGNWATAISAGARYGYTLLFVIALASIMAMLLQWISARVGVVTGRDLARLCRDRFSRRTVMILWIASEIAIIATDVAEVVGTAVALQLLFGLKLWVGVLIAAVATGAYLVLQRPGNRLLSALVTVLILLVAASFAAQLAASHPDWAHVGAGLVPTSALLRDAGMIWLAAGIIGATVMPHNLYLHSALVTHLASPEQAQEPESAAFADPADRAHAPVPPSHAMPAVWRPGLTEALRGVTFDTVGSLSFAFLINAALLVLAASVFHVSGMHDVSDLGEAHRLLAPMLHADWSSTLFALALLVCGLNSTVTGTLAGQAVMQGFLNLHLTRTQTAVLTRAVALGPALVAVWIFGDHGSATLLVASQVLLSLQLPMAVIPLVMFAGDARIMGELRVRGVLLLLAWACAAAIVALNVTLLWQVAVD